MPKKDKELELGLLSYETHVVLMKTDLKPTSFVHFLAELLIFFTGPLKLKMAKKHKGDIFLARKGAAFRTGAKAGWDTEDFPDKTINLRIKDRLISCIQLNQ